MVFKANKKQLASGLCIRNKGKKRGGQKGHVGHGRKTEPITQEVVAFLGQCIHCKSPLTRTATTRTHVVTDIPHWTKENANTTKYLIERQWCQTCHTEVTALPMGVLPHSKLGMNLLSMVCLWRYRARLPFAKIKEMLNIMYGIALTEGALVYMVTKTKQYLSPTYEKLLVEVRGSPVKHADETGWRIGGKNGWCWAFVTPKATIYTITESRGKAIAQDKLCGATGVLVRDDYGAYTKLPLPQQSCWAHLLRKSHEASIQENASEEMKQLNRTLKQLYDLLAEDIQKPYEKQQREEWYQWYKQDISKMIQATYQAEDAKRIQTRIRNQASNLLTALLYEDIPLTNNAAERAIRPFVVTRKISGGSQTQKGATVHAVNMSIIETIAKRKGPLLPTLYLYILRGAAVHN